MSAGLAALLDDIAALAKLAAASVDDVSAAAGRASAKAAGVVVDDAAVTPRFVQGVTPDRELPIIKKIAIGSLRNKLLFILPAALLLSQFAPWLLTPILMLGGAYLCFEGTEKVWEWIRRRGEEKAPAVVQGPKKESEIVSGAIRTDFILSAEIMVISLNEVAAETFWSRAAVLVVVAVLMTAVVYGAVGVIIKMDDVGLRLAGQQSATARRVGRGLVKGMKHVLRLLSVVGVVAMLWVGGHIWLVGADDLGWRTLYDAVHHLEEAVAGAAPRIGGFLAWLTNTTASAALGLAIGGLLVAAMHALPWGGHHGDTHERSGGATAAN